jgi:hypothetical protein
MESHPPAGEAGFLLPLSVAAALVLLLSSLSLSAAALQAHQLRGAERSRQQARDQLASTAHQLAAQLQGPYQCLLPIPSEQWLAATQSPPCPAGLDLQHLLHTEDAKVPVVLRRWQPDGTGSGGELWLQVGEAGLQKRYALQLVPGQGLREVG